MDRIFMDEYYEHLRADNIEAFSKKGTTNMLAELRNTKQQSRHCLKDWDLSICLTIAMN